MSDTPVTPISDWQLEPNVTCVVCPRCAFTFDAVHEDVPNGGHSCPLCEIDRQAQVIAECDATIAELRERVHVATDACNANLRALGRAERTIAELTNEVEAWKGNYLGRWSDPS